jgi:hypothetical protein
MFLRSPFASVALLASVLQLSSAISAAQAPSLACRPSVTGPIIVDSHDQVRAATPKVEPPLTDTGGFGFAWPDTQMGVLKTAGGYKFFTSDGALHPQQMWQGEWVGNNKYGSVTTTVGTLDNPLGSGDPQDVSISANPDPAVNPNYPSYGYLGGGPVYRVPAGMTGAGNLLVTYHAEFPAYAILGLAASWDEGLHWTDLGEIIRLNQSYKPGLVFHEIGADPLVLAPDGKYFYIYFPDWVANTQLTTHASVARVLASSLLDAAFGSSHPHTVPFEKYYQGNWHLQPGIGGLSTDLNPNASAIETGYLDVHFNSALQRYVMVMSNDTSFYYAESIDGLNWTLPLPLGIYGPIAAYPTSVGLGDDPQILGKTFYVYFTYLKEENGGLPREHNSLQRLTITCQ